MLAEAACCLRQLRALLLQQGQEEAVQTESWFSILELCSLVLAVQVTRQGSVTAEIPAALWHPYPNSVHLCSSVKPVLCVSLFIQRDSS